VESLPVATERANRNACADQKQFADIAEQLVAQGNRSWQHLAIPDHRPAKLYGTGKNQTAIPAPRSTGPVKVSRGAPQRAAPRNFTGNQGRNIPTATAYQVPTVAPTLFEEKGKENAVRFVQAQAGKRGTSIGDRAISFSQNGTPLYGDQILDRAAQENLAANQAAVTPVVTTPPTAITPGPTTPGKSIKRAPAAQVHPKGDSLTAGITMALAAAAITAIMFPIQYLISFFTFLLQVQTATSNIRNIASSTTMFFGNIAYLLGFGENVLQPVEKTFDGILNSVFGKEKVDYVKLQFAKLSVAVNAAVNIVDSVQNISNTLGSAIEQGANNVSRIGNALKAARVFDDKFEWMNEQISTRFRGGKFGQFNAALGTTSAVSSELANITREIKDAADEAKELEKEAEERDKQQKKDHGGVTAPKYRDGAPDLPRIAREIF
jgi:hypothetical protein